MKLIIQSPKKALSKDLRRQRPFQSGVTLFNANLSKLFGKIDEIEREENQKNHIRDFLLNTFYKDTNEVNTKDNKDLVIHIDKKNDSKVGVIIEAKRPSNKGEMISMQKPNCKAMHELILYYFEERETNNALKHLIATNIYEWYIFDANDFDKIIFRNPKIQNLFNIYKNDKKDTKFFYEEVAKILTAIDKEISCTYFDIRDYQKYLKTSENENNKKLIELYKILSPNYLLKVALANDSNALNEKFYKELLHIIGLEEVKDGSKYIIRRKNKENRNVGSLLENAISILETENSLSKIPDINSYGANKEERLFSVALELAITWINRILFLKLLEGQLANYHKDDKSHRFLNSEMITDYNELYKLFHQVLAVTQKDRAEIIQEKYSHVPYLNSSLFEISELESQTINIKSLDNSLTLELIGTTILKDIKKKTDKLPALDYIFKFLNAYDFASEGGEDLQDDNRPLINASVLGKVFEKINGYKDGSIYTPGFITMYMCRQSIRQAVVQKFKEKYAWNIEHFEDIKNYLADRKSSKDILEFNAVINSLHICDPAAGSGHFLVSALNEIIAIKAELGILADNNGIRISDYEIDVVSDELYIADYNGDSFKYQIINGKPLNKELQRLQKTLFHEKQTIIENCLFGVDINQNSVKICRLRLWIELLKNAYYKEDSLYTELETLPNIDINIKCGNSLLSRFPLDADMKQPLKKVKHTIEEYRNLVNDYKNCKDRDKKYKIIEIINKIKTDLRTEIGKHDPKVKDLKKYKKKLADLNHPTLDINYKEYEEVDKSLKKQYIQDINKLTEEIEEIKNNAIYKTAFEWRFEFPEVLKNNGDFEGFDLIIGNPPYIKEYTHRSAFDGIRNSPYYQGKMDIWYMFACIGIDLLKKNSTLSFIATNNWLTNAGASKLRNKIIQDTQIKELIDFGAYMIFENADIQTMVMTFSHNNSDNYNFNYRKITAPQVSLYDVLDTIYQKNNPIYIKINPLVQKDKLIDKTWAFGEDNIEQILNKLIEKANIQLTDKEIANGIHPHYDYVSKASQKILGSDFKVGDGIFVLSDKEKISLHLTNKELELIKPYYTTQQLKKYTANPNNEEWIIYTDSKFKKPENIEPYPNIKKHLDKFQEVITSDNRPYGLHRARDEHFFTGEKIIALRKCVNEPIFTYTDFDCYVSATFYVIKSERVNQKYLTGLLNSKLIAFWLRNKGKMQGNNYQLDKEPLLNLPIYQPSKQEQSKIVSLVDNILTAKKADPAADTSTLEREIDDLVYELYGLTEDEKDIVEGRD